MDRKKEANSWSFNIEWFMIDIFSPVTKTCRRFSLLKMIEGGTVSGTEVFEISAVLMVPSIRQLPPLTSEFYKIISVKVPRKQNMIKHLYLVIMS